MVKKLLKYEFKSVSKILIPLLLVIFGLAIILSLLLTFNIRQISANTDFTSGTGNYTLIIATGIFMFFAGFAIIVSNVVLFIMLMYRYYKNFFSDEAYLTFTLPVKTHELLLAKYISGFVWMAAGAIVTAVSIILIAAIGTAAKGDLINLGLFSGIGELYGLITDEIGTVQATALIIEYGILMIVKAIYSLSLYYFSITVGSMIAKKHKIFASIGIYLGISSVLSIFTSQFGYFSLFRLSSSMNSTDDVVSFFNTSFWFSLIMYIVISIGLYFVNHHMLSKKLNLE